MDNEKVFDQEEIMEDIVEEAEQEVIEEVKEEEAVIDEIADLKDKLIRNMADFDNYKKRSQKEKDALYEFAVCDVVQKILPILDTLKLSLLHEKEETPFKVGIELVIKQFEETLDKMNVKPIEAVGKTFDPNFHNAVMHIDDENVGVKEIVEEFQKGYVLNDKVLRFSMVKVAN